MVKHLKFKTNEGGYNNREEEKSRAIVTMSIKLYLNMINNHLNEKTNTIQNI